MKLGDAGVPGGGSDELYTGEVSTSPLSLDYYRTKAREFQDVLTGLDRAYAAVLDALSAGVSPSVEADLQRAVEEFQSKRSTIKLTAEAINAGAAAINAMGGRFPSLSLPPTLGLGPLVLPLSAIAAVGTAAALAVWGREWIAGVNARLKTAMLLEAQETPTARAALARSIADSDAALALAEGSIWSHLGSSIKWIAIGAAAFLLYRAFTGSRSD